MADISIIHEGSTDYYVKDAAGRLALAEVENKGAKNQFNIASSDAIDYKTTHNISGDTVTITGNAGFSRYVVPVSLKAGSYIFTANVNSISTSGRVRFNTASDGTGTNVTSQIDFSQAGSISRDFTINQDTAFFVMIYSSTSSADTSSSLVISQCMICTKAEWDISQVYVPYGKTNAELTAENTNQQSEINYAVNVGAKNLLKNTRTTTTHKGIKFTVNADGSVTANGTNDGTGASLLDVNEQSSLILDNGNYILTGCPAGGSETGYFMDVTRSPGASIKDTGNGAAFKVGGDYTVNEFRIVISRNITVDNLTFYPMIRPAEITDPTYEPYAPTNRKLYEACETKVTMQQAYGDAILIPANSDLNNYTTPGIYYALVANVTTIANTPYRDTGLRLVVEKNTPSGAAVFQTIYPTSRVHLEFFRRIYEGGSWSSWYKFEGTEVT